MEPQPASPEPTGVVVAADGLMLSAAGSGAILLDVAQALYSDAAQHRIWAVAEAVCKTAGVREAVPGMNNLLVVYDALAVSQRQVGETIARLWRQVEPGEVTGKMLEVPVVYGGALGEDLNACAASSGVPVQEFVRRHAAGTYCVAAIGAMPGFPYLSGLDPTLARPRRASPRASIPQGAVIIGGAQAGIMPQTAPSGWHILGHTDVRLFDPFAASPVLLQPGDTVRFVVRGIEA